MNGVLLSCLSLACAADPIKLPADVIEMQDRQIAIPVFVDPKRQADIARIRLFVSEDQGKTWKAEKKEIKPSDGEAVFKASRDGLYWFALQIVQKDGTSDPAKADELQPGLKVYVNVQRKNVKVQKSHEELQREIKELRDAVEQLQKRVKELESKGKSK